MAATMKNSKIYTEEDLAPHNSLKSCWVTRNGKVYDVTEFLVDHPGGEDLIIKHGGKDVEEAMKDKLEHLHSDSAYEMLEEYMIGRLGTDAKIVSEGQELVSSTHDLYLHRSPDWVATEDFHPEDTNTSVDYEKCQFLDLRKPLLSQVWYSNFRYVVSLLLSSAS